MIKYTLSAAFIATTLLLAACEKADEPTPEETGTATSGQATPAGQSAGTEGGGQVTEAEAKLIAEMEALQTKVDELQQEATNKTAETQAALVQQLNSGAGGRDACTGDDDPGQCKEPVAIFSSCSNPPAGRPMTAIAG
jgi:hypothetical protein